MSDMESDLSDEKENDGPLTQTERKSAIDFLSGQKSLNPYKKNKSGLTRTKTTRQGT